MTESRNRVLSHISASTPGPAAEDVAKMDQAYAIHPNDNPPKTCAITKGICAVDYAYVIPHALGIQVPTINEMKALGLVPAEFHSLLNALLHSSFDLNHWTFYPQEDALLRCIAIEEAQLVSREATMAFGSPDPGRPSYDEVYRDFPESVVHNLYFTPLHDYRVLEIRRGPHDGWYNTGVNEIGLPPVPPIALTLNINVVIRMRTRVLAGILSAWRVQLLGSYIMLLWRANPASFRQLPRPIDLGPLSASLSAPPIHPHQPTFAGTSPATDTKPATSQHRNPGSDQHLVTPLPKAAETLSSTERDPLIDSSDLTAEEVENTEKWGRSVSGAPDVEVVEWIVELEPMFPSFSSNEWAMFKYGVKLDGQPS
ncbi:hypothetical protein FRB95_003170 [Tulasnella sp. JGI-2019a]|nr:hypothetical protein FRB93_005043 [Tulasnella sp. JGI-2019a]KAG9031059.1 hypothetical protein FRB95_003170 [Tulasnella sp. JGI-2019a]